MSTPTAHHSNVENNVIASVVSDLSQSVISSDNSWVELSEPRRTFLSALSIPASPQDPGVVIRSTIIRRTPSQPGGTLLLRHGGR